MRDFVFVGDVARVNYLAVERGEGVYHIVTGKPSTLIHVVETMEELLESSIGIDIPGEFRIRDNRHDFAFTSRFSREFDVRTF